MKKILITGFSGFVSSYFIEFLEQNGIKSSVLGLDVTPPCESANAGLRYVECAFRQVDLLDAKAIDNTIYQFQPDYILHLASYSSVAFSWKHPASSFQNNTNIFLNLIESVRKLDLRTRILSVGSSEEYGNINADNLPLREDLPLDPISPYAVARVSQEMLARVYCTSYGMDIVLTRSFNHIGPRQRDVFVVPSFARQVAEIAKSPQKKGVIAAGDLSIVRDFTDVRDVVRAYYILLKQGSSGEIYNICSGRGVALKDILGTLAQTASVEVQTTTNPDFVRPNDNRVIIGSNEKLQRATGWAPRYTLSQSLADIFEYWNARV